MPVSRGLRRLLNARVFDDAIIALCIRWCITYALNDRDLITVAHRTILR